MDKQLKEALKVITEKCKEPNFYHQMNGKTLSKRIESIKGNFLHFVDNETLWYAHNVRIKKNPNDSFKDHPSYRLVELSKKERQKSIEALQWLARDVQACINHLENE